MRFDPPAFFAGFLDYLRRERASTLAYASVIAAPEHWVQFEALDWLHRNREAVGLGGGDPRRPDCDVLAEVRKNDIWLQDRRGTTDRAGVAIEFKVVHNNKNFWAKVKELRWDLSRDKAADGFAPDRVQRYGVAFLIYLRYVSGAGYHLLRSSARGEPCSPDEFLEKFRAECLSSSSWYGTLPTISPVSDIPMVVGLDDQPYLDPNAPGCAVWAVLLKGD